MTADQIREWTLDSITVDDTSNYYNCPLSPVGVYKIHHADPHSRDIFFVAACRSAGVPAYLDNATNIIYCWDGNDWVVKDFKDLRDSKDLKAASLTLTYRGKEPAKPIYWPHFTLAKLENGDLRTFDFEDDPRMASFPATISLEPGTYCLSTGNRYPDGAVRSRMEFFEVYPEGEPNTDEKKNNAVRKAGEKVTREIVILPLLARTQTLGTIDKHMELFDGVELWDYAYKEGMIYINLGDYSEPSKHLIAELKSHQTEMKAWGGMTFMVVGSNTEGIPMKGGLYNTDFAFNRVPGGSLSWLDTAIFSALKMPTTSPQFPIVALIDEEGQIAYFSTGYKIGVIEQVLKAAK